MFHASPASRSIRTGGTFDQLMRAAAGPGTEHLHILENLSPTVARILGRALAVTPGSRYQSAAEFAAELAPLVLGAKGDAATLMQQLFGEELRREAGHLAARDGLRRAALSGTCEAMETDVCLITGLNPTAGRHPAASGPVQRSS